MKAVSGEQMRKIEQIAIEERGISSAQLMENAAMRLTERCLMVNEGKKDPNAMIFCGSGNNGGDGKVLARNLRDRGVETKEINPGDSVTADDIESADLVVDALLGTGLNRNVDGNYQHLIEMINKHAKFVISADIPSGVNADTGQIMGHAVEADETVTFAYPKIGVLVYPGAGCAGKVHIGDISLPADIIDRFEIKAQTLTDGEAGRLLPIRKRRSNKGSFGKILIFAGSREMPGAASLASSAAYAVGAGLVCACVVPSVAEVIQHWQREVTTRIVPDKNGLYCKKSLEAVADEISRADAIVLGPGIGRSPAVTEFVREFIRFVSASKAQVPLVLDADALFAVSQDSGILKTLKAPCVITPHPGEMSRLTGIAVPEILDNIIEVATNFAKQFNVITLLKDAHTIIAHPDGEYYINTTGNSALAKAGTGDVLAGMIAGFIAQGSSPFTASVLGAYIHGKAGETASLRKSCYGVTASDVIENIPAVVKDLHTVQYKDF